MNKTNLQKLFRLMWAGIDHPNSGDTAVGRATTAAINAAAGQLLDECGLSDDEWLITDFIENADFGALEDTLMKYIHDYIVRSFPADDIHNAAYHGGLPQKQADALIAEYINE